MNNYIAVIGLGYVKLSVALAFAKKFSNTIACEINLDHDVGLKPNIPTEVAVQHFIDWSRDYYKI